MTKKNLPNIPIYIGDWERDCNVLSLESEAAWMRIVFKLWTKGKQNSIKIPAKSLQNLWRCSAEKMNEILNDLIYNEICEISIDGGFIDFTCRRFVKENKLSKIRSNAAKRSEDDSKTETKPKQTPSKSEQNTDNDNENENEIESDIVIKTKLKKKKEVFTEKDFPKILIDLGADKTHVEDWMKCRKNKKATNSQTALRKFIQECSNHQYSIADAVKYCAENSWSGFKHEWLNNQKNGNKSQNNGQSNETDFNKVLSGIDAMYGGK
jgi:uncharacterized protein YdaU (DUF1376 family)